MNDDLDPLMESCPACNARRGHACKALQAGSFHLTRRSKARSRRDPVTSRRMRDRTPVAADALRYFKTLQRQEAQRLVKRLAVLGVPTLDAYGRSAHWAAFQASWRTNESVPHMCVICGKLKYALHHRTYVTLGEEDLRDVVPLCHTHHDETHDLHMAGTALTTAHLVLARGFEAELAQRHMIPPEWRPA